MEPLATQPVATASAGVEGEWNNTPRTIRSACNRCHSQKLRCVRRQGEVICERCLKLHTLCRFGPRASRASRTPLQHGSEDVCHKPPSVSIAFPIPNAHSDPEITNRSSSEWLFSSDIDASIAEEQVAKTHQDFCYTMPADLADIHNFWSDPFCQLENVNSLNQYGSLDVINQDQFHDIFPSPDASDEHARVDNDGPLSTSPTFTIQKLANLNVALYDCAAQLPSMPEAGVKAGVIESRGGSSPKCTPFAIDELFRLTTEFIDVIDYLSCQARETSTISLTEDSNPSSTGTLSIVVNSKQLSHAGSGVAITSSERSFSQVDEGTILMIMSCHCRLTEIYLSIFQMMQACIKHSIEPRRENGWAIVLPRLQVGSQTAPPIQVDANTPLLSATSSMYMVMITTLASQLCEKLADMMTVGYEKISGDEGGIHIRGQGGGRREEDPISTSQYLFMTTVTQRTDHLRSTIDATKHLIRRFPLVAD